MKIALCQTEIIWEQKSENLCRACAWAEKASKQDAELILFPEMSFTGFSMNTAVTAEKDMETVKTVQKMASGLGIGIGFGWVKAGEQKAENHYTVVSRTGEILSDYVKIHPFRYSGENLYFEGGRDLCTFQMGGLCIGTLICYDLRFPEAFQMLAECCDLIVVPANWPQKRREHWKCLLQARSIECQTYLAGVNCCGAQQQLDYSGDSCIFAPDGNLLAGFQEQEGLLVADIPMDTTEYRKAFPTREDRKWELYGHWYLTK